MTPSKSQYMNVGFLVTMLLAGCSGLNNPSKSVSTKNSNSVTCPAMSVSSLAGEWRGALRHGSVVMRGQLTLRHAIGNKLTGELRLESAVSSPAPSTTVSVAGVFDAASRTIAFTATDRAGKYLASMTAAYTPDRRELTGEFPLSLFSKATFVLTRAEGSEIPSSPEASIR